MQAEFWLERWREGRIGFHRDQPLPLLLKYWPTLDLPPGCRVLVPLCGKTLDMPWLAAQGHHVLGVELSPLAVEQFFAEHGLTPTQHESPMGVHHVAGDIEIIQGDVFGLDDATLAGCNAVYDRAAAIALPPPLRERYAREVYARLPAGCRGLLVTLEYPPEEMEGPPFPVDARNADALFGHDWDLELLDRRDILEGEPRFLEAGVSALHTSVYRLQRKDAGAQR
ncbi:MAG: thiopurine S-methyltransferase [Rhodanobacter sp. 68-29]|nr:thiopurine S-methyltransferase [Rhodanobacter sp.]ODU74937.1 MAG: thiopurine S-methyltransferase [Rhodanobacter sp. SCN 69-32]OJY61454.1 MAG: thiopurine S-methyltransferase [Rhodanobacter sp. 68-29]